MSPRVVGSCFACGGAVRNTGAVRAGGRLLHTGVCADRYAVQSTPKVEGGTVETFDPTVTASLAVPLPEVGGVEPPLVLLRMTVSELVDSYLGIERTLNGPGAILGARDTPLRITLAGRAVIPAT